MPAGPTAGNPGWGHMSPQQIRNPWPDPNNLAQNVNEALGLGGAPGAPGAWGAPVVGPGDFGETAKIWSDPHAEQQHFQPMHNHHRGMNGMMGDPAGGDWMGGPGQSQQQPPMWSDPIKQEQEGYWKQQQQGGWGMPNGGPNQMGFPRGGPPNRGVPRGHGGPQMGMPMAPMRVAPPGGWNPQANVYAPMGRQQGGVSSDRGMWNRGGPPQMGGAGGGRGGYPGGVDMSVPPPIDMPPVGGGIGQMNGMRVPMPPGGMWKQEPMGGVPANGMRGNPYGQGHDMQMGAPAPFGMPPKQQAAPGQFPIAGADDLMWHDPNGDLKKWQRDTGVSLWGDPEKCNERPVRLWMVDEGEEEELETALLKCPVPPKRNEDGTARLPFNLPSKRPIVVTGWGELPENDPNNPVKPEDLPSGSKWGDMTPVPPVSDSSPWYLPGQQSASSYAPESPAWGQPPAPGPSSAMAPMQHMIADGSVPPQAQSSANPNTQQIADQLRYAVDKGYLDMSILTHVTLPPTVLQNMTAMLSKIPLLESVEGELKQLVDSVRPEGELEGSSPSPQRWMNEVQKVEYNRLIIDVTTSKIEVTDLSKKINAGLLEAGMGPLAQPEGNGNRAEPYHYSFLE